MYVDALRFAVIALEQTVDKEPRTEHLLTVTYMARIYKHLGRTAEARVLYEQVSALAAVGVWRL